MSAFAHLARPLFFARPTQGCGPGPGPFTTPHQPMKRPAQNASSRSGVSGAQHRARLRARHDAEVQLGPGPGPGPDVTTHEVGNLLAAFKAWSNRSMTEAEAQTTSEDLALSGLLSNPDLEANLSAVAEVVRKRRMTQKTGPEALATSVSSVGAVYGRRENVVRAQPWHRI